jgi:hypothetical protein
MEFRAGFADMREHYFYTLKSTKEMEMEKLSRRKVLVNLAAAGAGAVIAGTANAQGRQDANQCPQNPRLRAQEERLRNVLDQVEIANDHIRGVAARWTAPPEPDRPAFETLLTNVNTECQSVMETAHELLLRRGA